MLCVCVLCVCALCVCLLYACFCAGRKNIFRKLLITKIILKTQPKREGQRERRGRGLGRASRIFLTATSYSQLNCPRTCHASLVPLLAPPLQQSDRIDCNNAINVMNVRAGIYIQLLTACVHVCEHVCARLCLSMRVCVCACKRIYHLATLLFSLSTHDRLLQTTAEAHKSSGC